VQRAAFLLSIGGFDLQTSLTIEQVFSRLQGAFLAPSDGGDVVVMLTNDISKYRHVECISPALFTAEMATLDAMKRHFCHASQGYLLIACGHPKEKDHFFSASQSLPTPCDDKDCSVFFMTHAAALPR
jgi:hypothetical protein